MLAAAKYIGVAASSLIGAGKAYYNNIINLISFDLSYLKMIQQNLRVMRVKLFRIVQLFQQIKNEYILNYINKYSGGIQHSILLALIQDKLKIIENGEVIMGDNPHYNFALGIFLLSIVCLLCFINIFVYLITFNLMKYYKLMDRFPKINKLIKYFERRTFYFILIEGFMCLFFLFCIVIFSLAEILN
jgi:hypothetical protein